MPELKFATTQPQKSVVTKQHIWTIDSGISYTGSIGWKITGSSIHSNTESTLPWMDDKASSPCLKTGGIHRSRHSKRMDNTSLIQIYIHICDRDLPQSSQVPCSIDNTMHTPVLQSLNPMARYTQQLYF